MWNTSVIAEIFIGQHYSRVSHNLSWKIEQEMSMGKKLANGSHEFFTHMIPFGLDNTGMYIHRKLPKVVDSIY
jgi:hypothetical protein